MPTIKIRFPSGRYHATPWGHHVNEGLIEWPPCPWRLLRALVAAGFSSQCWNAVPNIARGLINKLASVLPCYHLPQASVAHSRHFMPIGELNRGREKTTLVFDTWANVGDGELFIHWPCELDAEESRLFSELVSALGYLGRSESWVEAEVTNLTREWDSVPCQSGERRGYGWEQVSLMAAIPPDEYQRWRQEVTEPILEKINPPRRGGKRGPSDKDIEKYRQEREQAVVAYPADLLSCLTKDTAWWKGHGWSQPPGSQRVLYWRRIDTLQVGVPTQRRAYPLPEVECVLLALSSPTGNKSPLPHVSRTLPQAEHIRRALICKAGNGERIDCPSLLGKINDERIFGSHDHAHFIPLDLDGDQHLDHILIYAKGKLCSTAQRAVRALKRTWTKGGVGELQLAIVASGPIESLRTIRGYDSAINQIIGASGGAHVWESVTPFVLPRFLKKNGKNNFVGQVQAELSVRGFPEATVEVDKELTQKLRHFVRCRSRGGVPPNVDMGFGLRLRFTTPVQGPILIGYASHYGLGLFRACS